MQRNGVFWTGVAQECRLLSHSGFFVFATKPIRKKSETHLAIVPQPLAAGWMPEIFLKKQY
jgi:hypothetical protein